MIPGSVASAKLSWSTGLSCSLVITAAFYRLYNYRHALLEEPSRLVSMLQSSQFHPQDSGLGASF